MIWLAQNSQGNTALHVAVLYHNVEVAEFLLDQDPGFARIVNKSKEAPLHLAITQEIDFGKYLFHPDYIYNQLCIAKYSLILFCIHF